MESQVYLIHLDQPYHHARHYIGFVIDGDVDRRLREHRSGNGAKMLRAVNQAGIKYQIVRSVPGTRSDERAIKNQKKSASYCPICRQKPRAFQPPKSKS